MPQSLDPRFYVLPAGQQQIWNALAAASHLGFVLYGGTAIALHLGHRRSIDFDFFRSEPLDKEQIRAEFAFISGATVLQDTPNTLLILAEMPAGPVKISFFGGIGFGRVGDPLVTRDGGLLIASLDDLMATKLKVILDRAEAKDYRDIAAMISRASGLSDKCLQASQHRSCAPSGISRTETCRHLARRISSSCEVSGTGWACCRAFL
jgi:hypothetical protein